MKPSCPNNQCITIQNSTEIILDGSYYRPSDGRRIQRYRCKRCGKRFSRATFHPAFGQNKRRINYKVHQLLVSGVSMRRIAKLLNVHQTTVARKVRYLGKIGRLHHHKFLNNLKSTQIMNVQLDDLITLEHTKCKPLSVTIAINADNRNILGIDVSSMPAFGHLAKISKKKYGKRKDERERGIKNVLTQIEQVVHTKATITSDEHPFYPKHIKRIFPLATHQTYKGERSSVAGQGELKKVQYDPLFSINHTCAMLRANINRLIRKTWCTTKRPDCLLDHLYIYLNYHNSILTI